jgi:hypothetical protein
MDKGGCLFFFRARWGVSIKPPVRGMGSGPDLNALLSPSQLYVFRVLEIL